MSAAPPLAAWRGKRVLLVGLGTHGGQLAVARAFARAGALVAVTDDKPRAKLEASARAAEEAGARLLLGAPPPANELEGADLVVRSPAVAPDAPALAPARARGVPITSEIVLTLERLRCPLVAVTGTKGKTTTTSLAHAVLARSRPGRVHLGGNIGRPLIEDVERIGPDELAVMELSSFMADDLRAARAAGASIPAPRVLVVTWFAPEHLDRHRTVDAYYDAKLSLADPQSSADWLVHAADCAPLASRLAGRGSARRVGVALGACAGADVLPDGDRVRARAPAELEGELFLTKDLRLIGSHNVRNAGLAVAAARLAGASVDDARAAVASFEPVPHRLELVARDARGVRYVNDSIATNPDASIAAIDAIPGPIVLLCGGSEKPLDYSAWGDAVAARTHAVVCAGASGPKLAAAVEAALTRRGSGARVERAPRFDEGFARARALCPDGGAVLLAPATASFDEFSGFEERGERFRSLVRAAVGDVARR